MISAENDQPDLLFWQHLTACWRPALVALASGILLDRDDAEDVVQDVMLGVVARVPALQSTSFSYLRAAVRQRAITVLRERHLHARLLERQRHSFQRASEWDPIRIDRRQLYADVVRCVPDLTLRESAVAKLRWWDGMTCHQIGQKLRIREKSVEKLLARARRKIRSACRSGD